jgi:hypothetical protein
LSQPNNVNPVSSQTPSIQSHTHSISLQTQRELTQPRSTTDNALTNTQSTPLQTETNIANTQIDRTATRRPTIQSNLNSTKRHDVIPNSQREHRQRTHQIIQQYNDDLPVNNDTWGGSMTTPDPKAIRIFFQNINGLKFTTPASRLRHHLQYMKDTGVTISGMAETNTNWHYSNITKHITANIQQYFPNSSVAFSANRFHPADMSPYLPGGCMHLCTGSWTGRIIKTIHDPKRMSRWIGHTYRLNGPRTLSIITAYRTCRQQANTNEQLITTTYQQKSLLYEDTGEDKDPREVFMDDIITLINKLEEDPNNSYILMWDANESLNDPNGAIR